MAQESERPRRVQPEGTAEADPPQDPSPPAATTGSGRRSAVTYYVTQRQTLAIIYQWHQSRDYGISLRELQERMGWASPHSANCMVRKLVEEGLLRRLPVSQRNIRLTRVGKKEAERWIHTDQKLPTPIDMRPPSSKTG